jgi:hypothetical protein
MMEEKKKANNKWCMLYVVCRLLSFRPLRLYRAGALSAARATHARLHARRRARLRDWLMR